MKAKTLLDNLLSNPRTSCRLRDNGRRTLAFLNEHSSKAFDRETFPAHITASAFILDQDRRRVLLMHHKKLDMWLQPGGHCDSGFDTNPITEEIDLATTAMREASEETGIRSLEQVSPDIHDIDIHAIKSRHEPIHQHFDVRFLFTTDQDPIGNDESHDIDWFTAKQLIQLTEEPSILRILDKMCG